MEGVVAGLGREGFGVREGIVREYVITILKISYSLTGWSCPTTGDAPKTDPTTPVWADGPKGAWSPTGDCASLVLPTASFGSTAPEPFCLH